MPKIDSLYRGIGCLRDVCIAADQSAKNAIGSVGCMPQLRDCLEHHLPSDKLGQYFKAIVCSWLNQEFQSTGRLYFVTQDGELALSPFFDDTGRTIVNDLLSD